MNRSALCLYLCLSVVTAIAGCTLEAPREFGDTCEDIRFIWTADAMIQRGDHPPIYDVNFEQGICPPDAQFCMTIDEMLLGDEYYPGLHFCSARRESCPQDTHPFEGKCERDTPEHCGSNDINCLDRAAGVAAAQCVSDGVGGKHCAIESCMESFKEVDGACRTGDQCCGDYCSNCAVLVPQQFCYTEENIQQEVCGEHCPDNAPLPCNGVCVDPMTSLVFCGSETCEMHYCPDLVEGWRDGSCIGGKCRVSDCSLGYHIVRNADGKICEKDKPDICGDYKQDCTDIPNAISVECHIGLCEVQKCDKGYYSVGDTCIEINEDNTVQCGGVSCAPFQKCNSETNACECADGYNSCSGVCYDLKSDVNHCGDCDTICRIPHADSECHDGVCTFVKCHDGYLYNETTASCEFTGKCAAGYVYNVDTGRCETRTIVCESDKVDCRDDGLVCCDCSGACGGDQCDNTVCDPVVECENGSECVSSCCIEHICVARGQCGSTIDCGQNAHVFEDGCESDSVENCGVHGNSCNVANADNDCIAGECTFECRNGYRKVDDGCMPNDCTDGDTLCTNEDNIGVVKTCSGGVYDDAVSCDSVSCDGSGTNCGSCKNGAKQCNSRMPQTCTDGDWQDGSECAADKICSGGSCQSCPDGKHVSGNNCITDACSGTETTCSNSSNIGQVSTCSGGVWGSPVSCSNVSCNSEGTNCGSCKDGAKQCNGRKPQTCTNGGWQNGTECAADKICSGGSCQSCPSGKHVSGNSCVTDECSGTETTCSNNSSNIGQVSTCSGGVWGSPSSCSNVSCDSEGSNCGSCKDGAKQCNGRKPQTCTNGGWQNGTACAADKICSGGSCQSCPSGKHVSGNSCVTDECSGTEKTCSNNSSNIGQVSTCSGGVWGSPSSCSNVSCNAAGTNCGVCKNGAKQCNGRKPQTCTNGGWQNGSECPSNQICSGGSCQSCPSGKHVSGNSCVTDECTGTEKTCSNNSSNIGQVRTCSGGEWGSPASCSNVSCNAAGTNCGVCKDGAKQCNGRKLQTCTNGGWQNGTACAADKICSGGSCQSCPSGKHVSGNSCVADECSGTETTCSNNSSNIGQVRTCSGGVWGSSSSCSTVSCNSAETNCGVCKNGAQRCNIHTPQTCTNGGWQDGSECASNQICSSGKCVSCGINQHEYNNTCEDDSVTNCGSHGNDCSVNVQHASSTVCSSGNCQATACETTSDYTYVPYNGICVRKARSCSYNGTSYLCMTNESYGCTGGSANGCFTYGEIGYGSYELYHCTGTYSRVYCFSSGLCSNAEYYLSTGGSCLYW